MNYNDIRVTFFDLFYNFHYDPIGSKHVALF